MYCYWSFNYNYIWKFKKVPNMKKCKGTIVATEVVNVPNERNKVYGQVQYFVDGTEYCIKTNYASMGLHKGKKINVKYNSENPKEAIVVSNKGIYMGALIFICFGIYVVCSTIINNQINNNECCECLDCPECDVCCNCDNPYLNK